MTMTDDRQASCEKRIAQHLASREESLAGLYASLDAEDAQGSDFYDEQREEIDNYALGITMQHSIRVDISTGGPGEWLEIPVERQRSGWEISGAVVFHFVDWFDHAERTVPEDSALYRYAEEIVETMWEDEI